MDRDRLSYWQRKSFSRRRFGTYAGAAGAGVAGLALVGCGDDDDDTNTPAPGGSATAAGGASPGASSSPAAGTPKKGGTMTIGVGTATNQSLDPHRTLNLGFTYYGIFLGRIISPEPVKITPYQGELVQSWEQVDKTTYNFKVRPNVTWHEGKVGGGRAVTAEDIAFNLKRIAGMTDPARAAAYQRRTNLFGMEDAKAVDGSTVKITFSTPNSGFLAGVADWRNWVITPEQVDKDPDWQDIKNVAGTGPFMIDSWDQATLAGKYVANKKYWKQGQPYLDSVEQVSLSDAAATQAAFLSGKLDFTAAVSAETRADYSKRSGAKIVTWPNLLWDYFGMNQNKAPFTDVRVRQAIFKLVDYNSLMDQEYGKGFWEPTGVLLSGLPGAPSAADIAKTSPWDASKKQADITDAKAALSSAGFPNGKGLDFKIMPTGSSGGYFNHAIRVQEQLKNALPDAKVEVTPPADGAEFARKLSQGDYDMVMYTAAPPPDAIFDPAQRLKTGGARNYTKFSDSQIDATVDKLFAEFDEAARKGLFDALGKRITETILNVPIGKVSQSTAVQGRIQGFAGALGVGSSLYAYEPVNASDRIWVS